jgi:hypothetical protein
MGEVEFIARVEEVAGPEYVRVAGPEAGGGPSLSSVGREVQQPYIQEHSASVLSAEVAQEMQQAKVNPFKSGSDVQTVQEKELTMVHNARCTMCTEQMRGPDSNL